MIHFEYLTSDIVLAATLKYKNVVLKRIALQGNRGVFFFSDVDQELLDTINLGNARVEPYALHNEIKMLTTAVMRARGPK